MRHCLFIDPFQLSALLAYISAHSFMMRSKNKRHETLCTDSDEHRGAR